MSTGTSAATDQQGLKKNSEASEAGLTTASVGNTQNVASSLTTTAGKFFRKYTSPSSTTNIEMGQIGNKTVKSTTFHIQAVNLIELLLSS